jgi:hypothetical protein
VGAFYRAGSEGAVAVGAGARPTAINGAICEGGNGEGKRGAREVVSQRLFEGAWEASRRKSRAAVRPEAEGSGMAGLEEGDELVSGPDGPQVPGGLARSFGPDGLKGSWANAGGKKRNQHTGLGQEK